MHTETENNNEYQMIMHWMTNNDNNKACIEYHTNIAFKSSQNMLRHINIAEFSLVFKSHIKVMCTKTFVVGREII